MSKKYLTNSNRPFDSSTSINRRSDKDVRSAIDEIQKLLFDPQATEKIFPLVVEQIKRITKSDYGVIFSAKNDDDSIMCTKTSVNIVRHISSSTDNFINDNALVEFIRQRLLPTRPCFFNAPFQATYAELLINPSDIEALLFLPILSRGKLIGVSISAKVDGTYDGVLLNRLIPLVGSVICALQSADAVKGNLFSLNQKISDNRFLSTLMSTSLTAILVVDDKNNIVNANHAARKLFESSDASQEQLNNQNNILLNKQIEELLPDYESMFRWSNQQDRYGEEIWHAGPKLWEEQRAIRGGYTPFLVDISIFRYTHGKQRFTTLQIQDVTPLHDSIEEYKQTAQQLNALTNLVSVGIIRVDVNWNCIFNNDKWLEMSGLINEESLGNGWINAFYEADVKAFLENLRESLQLGNSYHQEIRVVTPLGQVLWTEVNTSILFDAEGAVEGFLATITDITERYVNQEKMRRIAEYDGLTGLVNRTLFQTRLEYAFQLSERENSMVTVFFMDLDGFKDINDTLGHDMGDKLLKKVAERLVNTLRKEDTVSRFGGDEFTALLSHAGNELNLLNIAAKVVSSVSEMYVIDGNELFVTVSLGISSGHSKNCTPNQLLKQADAALYLAKAEGKNNYQLFNDELDKKASQRVYLAKQLRLAMKHQQFYLVYQPQGDTLTQQIIGFEALLRFRDERGNVVMPNSFIPILEETGMIIEVGRWIIKQAFKQLRLWQLHGIFPKDGFMSINVSSKQLLDQTFTEDIIEASNDCQVDLKNIVIEITESVLIDKPTKVNKVLCSLKALGVKIALDDFGTGYSSLTYLQRYPFDHIKIDKSFVADVNTDENDAKITKAIIVLAKSLGLQITAEGVSDSATLDIIGQYESDFYQGYLLSKPLLPDHIYKLMKKDTFEEDANDIEMYSTIKPAT